MLDPQFSHQQIASQVVVQVVIIADDDEIRDKLADHGFHVQTVAEVAPIEVQPARVLSHLYTYLGRNKKLGLTGRKSRDVGILSTSKLYSLKDRIFAFTPQVNIRRSSENWEEIIKSFREVDGTASSLLVVRCTALNGRCTREKLKTKTSYSSKR